MEGVGEYEDCVLTDDTFNEAIGYWDVSSVTSMAKTFYYATSFNAFIGGWDVSKGADMSSMFYGAFDFNQDIGAWDTSAVTDMTTSRADQALRAFRLCTMVFG